MSNLLVEESQLIQVEEVIEKGESEILPLPPIPSKLRDNFTDRELSRVLKWFNETSKTPEELDATAEPGPPTIGVRDLIDFYDIKNILHRRSFKTPSYAQMMSLIESWRLLRYTREQFFAALSQWTVGPDTKEQIQLAFQVFDTEERGFLELEEIKIILTSYGDKPFEEEEVIEILRDMNTLGHGNVDYNKFIDFIFTKAPELHNIKAAYIYDPDDDPTVPPLPPEPEPEPEPEKLPTPPPEPEPEPTKGKSKGKSKGKKKK